MVDSFDNDNHFEGDLLIGLEWSRSVFDQTARRFIAHYKKYLSDHSETWTALEGEHQNLIRLATQLWITEDYKNLLVVRDDLQPYFDLRGHWPDSLMLNEWAISVAKATDDKLTVARFTHDRGDILLQDGNYSQPEELYEESEMAYRSLGNNEMALHSRHMRSLVVRARGRLDEAEQLCRSTIDEARALGLSTWLAHPLYVMGLIERDLGNFQEAQACVEKSLTLLSETDEKAVVAQCHHFLGELALMTGKYHSAHTHLEQSMQLSREVGILRRVAATTRLIGDLARVEGKCDEAARRYDQAIQMSTGLGDRPELAKVFTSKGKLCRCLKNEKEAIIFFERANSIHAEIGDPRGRALAMYYLFQLYIKRGKPIAATECLIHAARSLWDAKLFKPRYLRSIFRRGVTRL
jgi:tetratricopeptide (TPR) repeat protein